MALPISPVTFVPQVTITSKAKAQPLKEKLFQKIADDLNLRMESIRNGFIIQLENESLRKRIVGYTFGLNDDAATRACTEKTVTAAILAQDQVPHVEHILVSDCDPYEVARQYNYNLVCKPDDGQMGRGVIRVRNREELQKALSVSNLCLSPYYEIEHEYRTVLLNHVPQVVFEKVKPQIVGDGKSTVRQLIGYYILNTPPAFLEKMEEIKFKGLPLRKVLSYGTVMSLQWKHSLFRARVLDPSKEAPLLEMIHKLAIAATKSLKTIFCCVDVIAIQGGDLRVLEVNSSVWLTESEIGYQRVKQIYTAAVALMFGLDPPTTENRVEI